MRQDSDYHLQRAFPNEHPSLTCTYLTYCRYIVHAGTATERIKAILPKCTRAFSCTSYSQLRSGPPSKSKASSTQRRPTMGSLASGRRRCLSHADSVQIPGWILLCNSTSDRNDRYPVSHRYGSVEMTQAAYPSCTEHHPTCSTIKTGTVLCCITLYSR